MRRLRGCDAPGAERFSSSRGRTDVGSVGKHEIDVFLELAEQRLPERAQARTVHRVTEKGDGRGQQRCRSLVRLRVAANRESVPFVRQFDLASEAPTESRSW